ncbi:MAG: DNA-directed RNA polymerase subunit alpha [Desulfohalobiaceae bacterium]
MLIKDKEKVINCKNWTELVKPEQLIKDDKSGDTYGRFICEPLERGFGTTLGNALRRVLLSSLQGAAIVAVNIEGVQHEFTSLPGVQEDITDVILNLKQVRLAMDTDEPQRLELHANQAGEVRADQIQENQHVSILNPEQKIATLSEDRDLRMELEVRMGKSYVPAEQQKAFSDQIGLIVLDASFSPIRKVSYRVEQARVGQMTNYDKLILEIWTDGSVSPEDSIAYSAKILKDQLSIFVNFDEEKTRNNEPESSSDEIDPVMFKNIEDLELPVRASNCLKKANIHTVGELVQKTEGELLRAKNFGRKSLDDILKVLNDMGLDLGMKLKNFEEQYEKWLKRNEDHET